MSAMQNNTPDARKNQGRDELGLEIGRFFKIFHKAHADSPISIAVTLLVLVVVNFAVLVGFSWASERLGLSPPACQGVAFGMLLLTLVPSSLITRGMLLRQSASFPKQGAIPEKPFDWEKPPEKLKSVEKNSRMALSEQSRPPGRVPKQPTNDKSVKRGKKASRGR